MHGLSTSREQIGTSAEFLGLMGNARLMVGALQPKKGIALPRHV